MSKPQPLPNAGIDGFVVPRHVAIIMDGNGRWASARGLPRSEGHRRGVEALRRTVRAAGDLGIGILTIFSFSSENWSRPPAEIRDLMGLLRRFVRNDLAELHQNGVHVRVIGEREDLDPEIRRLLEEAEDLTRDVHNSARGMAKSVVVDDRFDWGDDRRLDIPWSETIIYETHVKGISMRHPDVLEEQRGTYLGVASEPIIEHF